MEAEVRFWLVSDGALWSLACSKCWVWRGTEVESSRRWLGGTIFGCGRMVTDARRLPQVSLTATATIGRNPKIGQSRRFLLFTSLSAMPPKSSPSTNKPKRAKAPPKKKARRDEEEDATESESGSNDAGSPGYGEEQSAESDADEEVEVLELDSDDLDGEDSPPSKTKKRKSFGKAPATKSNGSGKKVKGGKNTREVEGSAKVAAPKEEAETSLILPSTMEFLRLLRDSNDRDVSRRGGGIGKSIADAYFLAVVPRSRYAVLRR